MLKYIAYPILFLVNLVLGSSGLEATLIQSIFKIQKRYKDNTSLNDIINERKPLKVHLFNYMRNMHNMRQQRMASSIIQDELDIANFLRRQLVTKIAHKTLFTNKERYLMNHQADPFVIKTKTEPIVVKAKTEGTGTPLPYSLDAQGVGTSQEFLGQSLYYNKLALGVIQD